jgi:hypothetical protein
VQQRLIPLADKSTTASAASGGSVVTGVTEVTEEVTGEMIRGDNGCVTMGSIRRMRKAGRRVVVVRVCDDDDDGDSDNSDDAAVCDGDKSADVSNDDVMID